MRRVMMLVASLLLVVAVSACLPPNPGPGGLYLGTQANITPVVTPKAQPITWGAAPVIDEHYGQTLYVGTSIEAPDPRPPLLPGGLEPLRMWVADPHNNTANRPAIVWFHGGGFAVGLDSMYGLANGTGKAYAARGYVSFSVEYRIDTTLIGTQTGASRPPSLCQWVQDHPAPTDPVWIARRDQCKRNILAAQYDTLAAVRWIRLHAAEYQIDPNRIAIGGFSAGAVIASQAAYQFDDVGTVSYFAGDDLSPATSKPQAAIGASGCTYTEDGLAPTTIGPGDRRLRSSRPASTRPCPTMQRADDHDRRSQGLVAELTSYCTEGTHAETLYSKYQAATDQQWTTFLARELKIYTAMPAATAAPVCPN